MVLFNGGTIKPNLLRARILGVMGGWYETLSLAKPRGLMNADADLAVAHGAVYYGRVRRGQGIRIHGGAPRSYYVGLGTGDATAGEARQLLLVAPRGMEEGDEIPIPSVSLKLKVGRLVAFPLYASSTRIDESVGSLVELEDGAFTALAPLSAV
ncbi:MAG: hypothetical protein GW802_30465, partial [Armatimonadetes bacterium]|nr:hypothetical protein [Armatimonadota bacterium]